MKGRIRILVVVPVAVVVAAGIASGFIPVVVALIVTFGVLVSTWAGARIANDADREWLSMLLPVAFLAKMAGAGANYFVLERFYGVGDAIGYHLTGVEIAPVWRSLTVPEVTGGSFGTQVTGHITGLLYAVGTPPMVGGFLIFATLSFIGMVCFYVAFRSSVPRWGAFPYFALLFFLPTMLYWPSSVGKDALITLGLGLIALGTVRMMSSHLTAGLWLSGAGGLVVGLIRPHVLAIAVGAIVVAVVFSRAGQLKVGRAARILLMMLSVVTMIYVVPIAAARIGADDGLEQFIAEQQERTARGGSAVIGEPATSPFALPSATVRVLFRPLIYEASSPGLLLSALEGLALLGIIVWRLPTMWANRHVIRMAPYLLMSLAFTAAFVVAFSSIFNLGILARQRSQVIPFLLVVMVGLGWRVWSQSDHAEVERPKALIG